MAGSDTLLQNIGQALSSGGAKPSIKVKVKVKVPVSGRKLNSGRIPSAGRTRSR